MVMGWITALLDVQQCYRNYEGNFPSAVAITDALSYVLHKKKTLAQPGHK